MAEEHRFQAQRLCANNCGFFGSPTTQNLCSKCYRDLQLKEQQSSSAKHALNQTLTPAASSTVSSSSPPALSVSPPAVDLLDLERNEEGQQKTEDTTAVVSESTQPPQQPNRCLSCRRRVGITGFKCRCGSVFCGAHRYPEQHNCGFDFKGLGKEQIAKANPVVKAEKLEKI